MKEQETAPFKEWQLLQIEGEEPVPVEETPAEAKPSPAKGKAPAKGGAKQVVEEITDNRPRTIQLKRDLAEENGGVGVRFTEPFSSNFATVVLKIHTAQDNIYFTTVSWTFL